MVNKTLAGFAVNNGKARKGKGLQEEEMER